MKIHIIGGSGTGKSYISKKISLRHHIPHFDLDTIFWDNSASSYGTTMPADKRAEKLNSVLKLDSWVIEGVYYDWLVKSFILADYIFILKTKPIVCDYRIIKRFIKRKLGIEKSKKETLKSLIKLLFWTNKFQKKSIPKIISALEPYRDKVVILDKTEKILGYMNRARYLESEET